MLPVANSCAESEVLACSLSGPWCSFDVRTTLRQVNLGPAATAAHAANFRSDLAKNSPKKFSYDPGSKARNDRQHQGGVSRV